MEDLNYLLKREQEELLRAERADSGVGRIAHDQLARGYARRIRDHRHPYRTPAADGAAPFDPAPYGSAGLPRA
jgi:hypothetical protein